eukprot:1316401-Amphidinium_carterae.1
MVSRARPTAVCHMVPSTTADLVAKSFRSRFAKSKAEAVAMMDQRIELFPSREAVASSGFTDSGVFPFSNDD